MPRSVGDARAAEVQVERRLLCLSDSLRQKAPDQMRWKVLKSERQLEESKPLP